MGLVTRCAEHPVYLGMRTPRTNCEYCWIVYARRNDKQLMSKKDMLEYAEKMRQEHMVRKVLETLDEKEI